MYFQKRHLLAQRLLIAALVLWGAGGLLGYGMQRGLIPSSLPAIKYAALLLPTFVLLIAFVCDTLLLLFVCRFAVISRWRMATVLVTHALTVVVLTMFLTQWTLDIPLPAVQLVAVTIFIREICGCRDIDNAVKDLCAEMDQELIRLAMEEQQETPL